jgi:hypothetical protein
MAGIFPDVFGAGAGDGLLPFGPAPLVPGVIDGNRNAILGYLAGALQAAISGSRSDAGCKAGQAASSATRRSRASARPCSMSESSRTWIPA